MVHTNGETLENNVDPDNYDDDNDDKEEHVNSDSDSDIDETEVLEKLIAELLENNEDRDESDVDDDNTEQYVAQVILPGGLTTRSGRLVKPRDLQDYAYYFQVFILMGLFYPYFSFIYCMLNLVCFICVYHSYNIFWSNVYLHCGKTPVFEF